MKPMHCLLTLGKFLIELIKKSRIGGSVDQWVWHLATNLAVSYTHLDVYKRQLRVYTESI